MENHRSLVGGPAARVQSPRYARCVHHCFEPSRHAVVASWRPFQVARPVFLTARHSVNFSAGGSGLARPKTRIPSKAALESAEPEELVTDRVALSTSRPGNRFLPGALTDLDRGFNVDPTIPAPRWPSPGGAGWAGSGGEFFVNNLLRGMQLGPKVVLPFLAS